MRHSLWLNATPALDPSEPDTKEFIEVLKKDSFILRRLVEIIKHKLSVLEAEEESLEDYTKPGWEGLIIRRSARRKELKDLLMLLENRA